jgi:hypothetical protein
MGPYWNRTGSCDAKRGKGDGCGLHIPVALVLKDIERLTWRV